jgi:MoxR-like ATPase
LSATFALNRRSRVYAQDVSLEGGRFQSAIGHFASFFGELNRHFAEREELLQQIALALLSREHVLISGPPGTAKSRIAGAVLRRIVDEGSRQPSVYARQFTESTVQTDLIGPIDFKTLTETGRTEHFTDEGMLGAVHAFLDEVFDGRDMLLRSTLNVLHERELKQGTKTTLGQIECAVMTTNRYLSEILEHSRETLLAFIDRIAFVSFVPKGFANPESLENVLRTQVVGHHSSSLTAPLTIQNIDVLQTAVDAVRIPPALCQSLVALVRDFEAEAAAALRADPTFVPTRYLSTRSIVRLGKLLKAICVFDRAFYHPARPLVASFADLAWLRLGMVLGGCSSEAAARLLETETDPRERRQLALLRTEREIFDRCLARLQQPTSLASLALPNPLEAAPAASVADLSVEQLLIRARELSKIAENAEEDAAPAADLLGQVTTELTQRAFASGLTARLGTGDSPIQIAAKLAELADELERTSGDRRLTARWLRGRALDTLHRTARLVPTDLGTQLQASDPGALSLEAAEQQVEAILTRLSNLGPMRERLRADGALENDPEAGDAAWREAVERALESIVYVWDRAFHTVVDETLGHVPATKLAIVIQGIREPIARMDAVDRRLTSLHPDLGKLKARVVGPRIGALVNAAFARFGANERLGIAEEVAGVLETLSGAGLLTTIAPRDLLTWTAEALLRNDPKQEFGTPNLNQQGYRNLRLLEQRVTCIYALVDVCLRLLPGLPEASAKPLEGLARVREQLNALPPVLLERLCERDLERIERPVGFLERWWALLRRHIEQLSPVDSVALLVRSDFFQITMNEQALARFELELELLRQVTGLGLERADQLSRRIAVLSTNSSQSALECLKARTDGLWKQTLSAAASSS